ncbi:MAG: outer membrane protein assembly factor BamE [Rhodoferax sp.]|nr:outer membrane protein assembly factor BamE [Rhodoferax sp.]
MPDLPRHRPLVTLILAACAAMLAGCSSFDGASSRIAGIVTPYRMDLVQGNFVSKEQVDVVKPGMTRGQVREILGTPLLTSVFHADRWDYVFTFKRQGTAPQQRKLTAFFKGDALERLDSDALPTETEFVAALDSGRQARPVPPLEMTEAQLKAAPPAAKAVPTPPLPQLPASYPPLEPPAR